MMNFLFIIVLALCLGININTIKQGHTILGVFSSVITIIALVLRIKDLLV